MRHPHQVWIAVTAAAVVGGGLLARALQRRTPPVRTDPAEDAVPRYTVHGVWVSQGQALVLPQVTVHGIQVTRTPPRRPRRHP